MELFAKLTALILSIILHEVAHGYVAYRLGDPTARDAKRLRRNPLAQYRPNRIDSSSTLSGHQSQPCVIWMGQAGSLQSGLTPSEISRKAQC